ncbi:MAG: tetratricopeptide repeat protein [Limisphaerales bacterium]
MPEKSLTEIPRAVRDQYEKGVTALERSNLDYAIELLLAVLKSEPGFLAGREALRRAAQKKAGEKTGLFKKLVSSAGSGPALAKAKFLVESQPLEALFLAEQALAGDPRNSLAHDIFAQAAVAAELPRSAILSLEAMRQESPADKEVTIRLSEIYSDIGMSEKAEAIFAALLKHHPNDPRLNEMAKNLSAKRTLSEGGYESIADGKGSFRDILKDKGEANRLEQESRITKDAAQSQNLIEQYQARLTTDPGNLRLLKNIAELYVQQKDYYHAIEYYNQIEAIPGAMDAMLEQARNDTVVKRYNQVVEQLDPAAEDYETQKATITAERDAFILSDCLARVERYPTDKAIRFELGMLYFNLGRLPEALPEFQQAENNPHKRVQAMLYSARCMAARNMNDMAARKLQNALKEKQGFDDERKELLYTLGVVLEKMGKAEDSIQQFMAIYEVDMKFRDVEDRVNRHYGNQG